MTSIAPVHIVISEDPLLSQEACDQIIESAKKAGVSQRDIVDVADKMNWDELFANAGSLSLFAELKLTDIRFSKAPNKEAQNALVDLVDTANSENMILIRLPKIEKRQKSTKWFKAISSGAKVEEIWPPRAHEFSRWLTQRAQTYQLQLDSSAVQMLVEQTEGNLLAANQMLQKLQLLFPEQLVRGEDVAEVISDNAKYSVFLCLDEALAGKGERAVRMLGKFKQEGVAPISILVNLIREVEYCNQIAIALSRGQNPNDALAKSFLWDSKKKLLIGAASKLPLAIWQRLVIRCAFLDRLVKGQEKGDIWQELESCLWLVSGRKIWGQKKA